MAEGVRKQGTDKPGTEADRRREEREEVVGGWARIGDDTYPLKNWSPNGFCIGSANLELRPGQRLDIHFTIPLPERMLSFRCRTGVMRYDSESEEIGGIFFNLPEQVQAVVDAHFEVTAPKGYGNALFDRLRGALSATRRLAEARARVVAPHRHRQVDGATARSSVEDVPRAAAAEAEPGGGPAGKAPHAVGTPVADRAPEPVPADTAPAVAAGQASAEPSPRGDLLNIDDLLKRADQRVRQLYEEATAEDLAEAQHALGYLFETGDGVPQDLIEAAAWYLQAAEQGHAGAQNNLGLMYYAGRGVPQDYEDAAMWYRRAAEQDDHEAQFNLGLMYCYGHAVAQDYVEAHMWWSLAAEQGNESARGNLNDLADYLSADDLAEAERRLRTWRELRRPSA
jgi:uncharacterized protein